MTKNQKDQTKKIMELANEAINAYLDGDTRYDGVNPSDLKVTDVLVCESLRGGDVYAQIVIDEAAPDARDFKQYIVEKVLGMAAERDIRINFDYIQVDTQW